MSFKARRLSPAALVLSLLIQMHIPGYGCAALGTKIVFTCAHDEHFDICVMDGTGRNEVKLTDDPVRDDQPSWSPDGARIAFRRNLIIYVMDSDGRNLMKLGGGSEPAWSPDGAQIAFTCHPQICVMDADGGNRIQLTEWGKNNDPAWSPDSNRIAFVTARRQRGWKKDLARTTEQFEPGLVSGRRHDCIRGMGSRNFQYDPLDGSEWQALKTTHQGAFLFCRSRLV